MAAPEISTGPMVPRPFRVTGRVRETEDVVTLSLEPLQGDPPPFLPGQFNMLYAFGVGESAISISGDPSAKGPIVHTIRGVGAVTSALCAARPGTVVGVRGPFGEAWDTAAAEGGDVVIVAGGIGLAPLRPAISRVLSDRERYRRVSVLVGARAPEHLLYPKEISRWRSRFDAHVDVTVDAAGEDWKGSVGLVTELIDRTTFEPAETTALVCGPEVMIRFTARTLADRGVPSDRIRVSLERNMKCAVGHCGHCQLGPYFVCTDGPVFPFSDVERLMAIREV